MRLLSLFSGIGAFEKALDRCNINYELVNYCEIDKHASKAYSIIHNVDESKNLKDVTKIDASALPRDLDLITYGFPCVPKGYMIKVENGYKAIEDITDSDLVLTHTNTYKKVVKTMKRISDHIIHIKGVGCTDLQVTDEHPLYVLRNGEFTWVKAKDLNTETDYLCYNINNKAIPCDYSDAVLWLMGRYFADSYKENHSLHRPIFCIGKKKIEEFETYIKPFKFSIAHSERSAVEYKITDDYLCEILSSLTTGSTTKEIPQWIVDLPKQQLEAFYKGYFSGDGHSRKDRELYMFCTASKNMFLSLQDIVIKLYNVVPTVSIRHDARKATYNDTYNVQYSYRPKDQIVKDNKVCVKIKDVIRELKDIEVFNFEVEEDNSYTVNNVIVHNCQDISVAGKQKGFTDENGGRTRSGLFFDALRIISATQPKFAIAENVKALTSKKFANEFKTVLTSLELAGYNNYYAVLNAKDYGIPQNRERVFIISIREDIDTGDFAFPTPFELKTRLKDLLEDEVDIKYYLSEKIQHRLQITDNTLSKNIIGTTKPEFRTIGQHDLVFNPNGVMGTLVATDHKQPKQILEPKRLFGAFDTDKSNPQAGRVYNATGISPSLDTCQGGNRMPKIVCEQRTDEGLRFFKDGVCGTLRTIDACGDKRVLELKATAAEMRGRENGQSLEISDREYSNALTTVQKDSLVNCDFRIRKLTPTECWRLMGFDDEDIDKCVAAGLSNSQLYKMAGNSIVVNCIEEIYKRLFKE